MSGQQPEWTASRHPPGETEERGGPAKPSRETCEYPPVSCSLPPSLSPNPLSLPSPHGLHPGPHHLKGLPQGQWEDAGHLLLAPAATLEGIAHHSGTGESRLDMEGDVPRLRQEVDLKPGGVVQVMRQQTAGWPPPLAQEGRWPLLVLSGVSLSLDHQAPAWGQAPRTEGFKLKAKDTGMEPPGCSSVPPPCTHGPRKPPPVPHSRVWSLQDPVPPSISF